MSIDALNWAKHVKAGGRGPKATLLLIADISNDFGVMYGGVDWMAECFECGRDTISRDLKRLQARGLVHRIPRIDKRGRRTTLTVLAPTGDRGKLKPAVDDPEFGRTIASSPWSKAPTQDPTLENQTQENPTSDPAESDERQTQDPTHTQSLDPVTPTPSPVVVSARDAGEVVDAQVVDDGWAVPPPIDRTAPKSLTWEKVAGMPHPGLADGVWPGLVDALRDAGFNLFEVEQHLTAIEHEARRARLPIDVDWFEFGRSMLKARKNPSMDRSDWPSAVIAWVCNGAGGPPRKGRDVAGPPSMIDQARAQHEELLRLEAEEAQARTGRGFE